ncbi:hypothetical protein OS242_04725 [Tumebacillus sp. DT12]|uniref:DUF4190 domain-containing protein n=1 Tax=Tumebacillus lacus TaxID=2995335 RepID=A0ABT3X0W9_9BACL|nr:hypothetical protein [Tumebacillus lacus]MCX7569256.1 hypothetical protein [Tumebacillus lacus]
MVSKIGSLCSRLSLGIGFLLLLVLVIGILFDVEVNQQVFGDSFGYPPIGIVLGLIGLLIPQRSKKYAVWGIFINVFLLVFVFAYMGISWTMINPKP